jgi:urea transport system ATP-binding protein
MATRIAISQEGSILCVTILGRNGVGKTTLLRTIMGINRAWEGSIRSDGKELVSLPPYDIARTGIAYVPQGRGLFPQLTVQENLYLGTKARRDRKKQIPDLVFQYFPVLCERLTQVAGTLSGGLTGICTTPLQRRGM